MKKRLLFVALLSLVLGYLMWSATDDSVDISSSISALEETEYDYYMNGIDNTVFSALGERRYRIQAERLTHYPVNDVAVLDAPFFLVYEEGDDNPWQITATNAELTTEQSRDEKRVDLIDNVVIYKVDENGRPLNIYTDFLTVYPDSKTVNTDRFIRITSPGAEITGTGMTGDLNTNHFKLLAEVRGTYE